eukprot:scaffold59204_cov31-Prasinocladus_malaysianus.AAC.1
MLWGNLTCIAPLVCYPATAPAPRPRPVRSGHFGTAYSLHVTCVKYPQGMGPFSAMQARYLTGCKTLPVCMPWCLHSAVGCPPTGRTQ